MAQLSQQDRNLLESYAANGKRFEYWSLLADRGDRYAPLALGVVTNETVEGYIANNFLAARAKELGKAITEDQNWEIGVQLMRADWNSRKNLTDPLNIPARPIWDYHLDVFDRLELGDNNEAWTAAALLRRAIENGDDARANVIWENILHTGFFEMLDVGFTGVRENRFDPGGFFSWALQNAGFYSDYQSELNKRISLRNLDHIDPDGQGPLGFYSFDPGTNRWYQDFYRTEQVETTSPEFGVTREVFDRREFLDPNNPAQSAIINQLNQQRQIRQERFGVNAINEARLQTDLRQFVEVDPKLTIELDPTASGVSRQFIVDTEAGTTTFTLGGQPAFSIPEGADVSVSGDRLTVTQNLDNGGTQTFTADGAQITRQIELPDPANPGAKTIISFENDEPSQITKIGADGTASTYPLPISGSGAMALLPGAVREQFEDLPNWGAGDRLEWDWTTVRLLPGTPGSPNPSSGFSVESDSGTRQEIQAFESGRIETLTLGMTGIEVKMDWNPSSTINVPQEIYRILSEPAGTQQNIQRQDYVINRHGVPIGSGTSYIVRVGGPAPAGNPPPASNEDDPVVAMVTLATQSGNVAQMELQLLTPAGNAVVKTAAATPEGVRTSDWEMQVNLSEAYRQAREGIPAAAVGNEIGELFGSSLGRLIGGGTVFGRIAGDSVLATVLGNVGESFGIALRSGGSLLARSGAIDAAFDNFSDDLIRNIRATSASAVSSFLVAELSEALNAGDGFGGQLFSTVANSVTNTAIQNALAGREMFEGLIAFDAAENITGGGLVTSVGSFVGSYLARQILAPQSTAGSIGASIGGSLGSLAGLGLATAPGAAAAGTAAAIGQSIVGTVGLSGALSSLGLLGNFLLPGIGALVGTLLGTIAGDWLDEAFGDEPRAWASVQLDHATGEFYIDDTWRKEGGNRKMAVQMAEAGLATLNNYAALIGGVHVAADDLAHRYGHREDKLYVNFHDGNDEINRSTAEKVIDLAVTRVAKKLRLAGGDVYLKRAIEASSAATIAELNGDLQIAQDYANYLANKDVVDLIIAADPNSAFAAGWVMLAANDNVAVAGAGATWAGHNHAG